MGDLFGEMFSKFPDASKLIVAGQSIAGEKMNSMQEKNQL